MLNVNRAQRRPTANRPQPCNKPEMVHAARHRACVIVSALAVLGSAGGAAAQGIEFRSVGEPTITYDAPSEAARRQLILQAGTPVEVITTDNSWVRIREPGGSLQWVTQSALRGQRTVLVAVDRAQVRREPSDDASPVFEAVRNVVLLLVDTPQLGWARVRHADGDEGYLRVSEVWGL